MEEHYYSEIEFEVIRLLRRADFKKTLDGSAEAMDRSAYILLKFLVQEEAATIGEISESFQLDKSTVSRQVSALEKKKWVRRYSDERDGRKCLVQATELGSQKFHEAHSARLAAYREFLQDWTEEELRIFSELIARLNTSIEQRKKLK